MSIFFAAVHPTNEKQLGFPPPLVLDQIATSLNSLPPPHFCLTNFFLPFRMLCYFMLGSQSTAEMVSCAVAVLAAVTLSSWMAACAVATPVTPVYPNVSSLPVYYLSNTSTKNFTISTTYPTANETLLVKGRYNSSNSFIGWDYCHLETLDDSDSSYFAAGFLEGWLGSDAIALYNFSSFMPTTQAVSEWVGEHIEFLYSQSKQYRETDRFWDQVGKLLQQMEGIAAGYTAKTNNAISFHDVFLLNFQNELGDVVTATQLSAGHNHHRSTATLAKNQHCSALIKVTHDDLFVAHDTWSGFSGLGIRVYKVYDFGGKRVAMDSFPGVIDSGTDWYITSKELAIQETTNIVWNTSLYSAVVPHTVSEFLRVMAANYLADSGSEWAGYFARYNSGTYNNQFMVVDYKRYQPGSELQDGLLWIAEQIPGEVVSNDETNVLRSNGYWASYNINYFESLYVKSGYAAMEAEQGTFWSYTKYARPEIFHRNQSRIYDIEGMQRMMRYNDWAADPFSVIPNCTGADAGCATRHTSMLTIASRGDLMPLYNTTAENIAVYGPLYSWVAQGCFGAVDSKISSYKRRYELRGLVINGPTNDQQPTFSWGENANCPESMRPPGTPKSYDFPWVDFQPSYL